MFGSEARVVVIPVGVGRYREPPPALLKLGRRRFDDLAAVDTDLARLAQLFNSPSYRASGFAVLPVVSGTAGEITDRLNRIAEELAGEPGRTLLLFWSGHGDTPHGGELRLATVESSQPMTAADGLLPTELVNKLAASGAKAYCLVLDVCQAGAAAAGVAATAAQRFHDNPDGRFLGMAALFSAQAYESAAEGLFTDVLERVLREGPSAPARARIAERGWGGFTHNRLLTMRELEEVVQVEFELLQETRPALQTPAGQSIGRSFGIFPNPLYRAGAPPLGVEVARRRWLRQQDLDSHFLPKARGLEPGEEGWFFTGRDAVSSEVVEWLQGRGEAGAQPLYVLTGGAGTGKSAIIGRLVALSDEIFRASAPKAATIKHGTVPDVGSFSAALHLRNLDSAQAAAALSELLGIAAPEAQPIAAWVNGVPSRLAGSARAVTIALDALDEAGEPVAIAEQLIRPLAARGWRFLIGTRRSAAQRGASGLLDRLQPAHRRDLDVEPHSESDIAAYVERRLAAPGSPYIEVEAQRDRPAIAAAVARNADGRFLYARLAVSALLRRPRIEPVALDAAIGSGIGDVVARDLALEDDAFAAEFGRADGGATALLAALAWGEGDGLPSRDGVWPIVAGSLHASARPFDVEHLRWVLREAGRYIVESGDGEQALYRLFHESLNEHFRAGRDAKATREQIAAALLRDVHEHGGWDHANPYVVRHLPAYYDGPHAGLERLCTDPSYLRRALELLGVDRLASMLGRAWRRHRIVSIEAVAKSVQRARVALSRDPLQLATQLHARLMGERSGALQALIHELPRVAPKVWLRSRVATLGWRAALQTMQTFYAKVRALAFGVVDGASVIAVGTGTQVILWDPREGALPAGAFDNDGLRVTGLAIGQLDGRDVLAVAAGYDARLVIRDAQTGAPIGEPMRCSTGTPAIGRCEGRVCVAIPDSQGYFVRTLDAAGPMTQRRVDAEAVGCIGGALVAIRRDVEPYGIVNLDTGEPIDCKIGPEIVALTKLRRELVCVGEWMGVPMLCEASIAGEIQVRDLRNGHMFDAPVTVDFPVRTVVAGQVEGDFIVAAGNESDTEVGYVAIRQPVVRESLPFGDIERRLQRVIGVGFAAQQAPGRAPALVLIVDGVGAVDPLERPYRGTDPEAAGIELVAGARSVPATIEESAPRIPGGHGHGRGFILRRDRPLQWPVRCEAWATIDGRLLQVRGSYAGGAWILDAGRGEIVAGPFRDIGDKLRVWTGVKGAPNSSVPADAVALATWDARATVAIAHIGRATVFDVESGQAIGSPDTKHSEIVAVALGECQGRPLLATGSSGGAVAIWQGPAMLRLAGVTLDTGVRDLWLARDVLAVRTADQRFHVFDLVVRS